MKIYNVAKHLSLFSFHFVRLFVGVVAVDTVVFLLMLIHEIHALVGAPYTRDDLKRVLAFSSAKQFLILSVGNL